MSSKILSIIIPMYRVAPYIERCLRSLTNQDISFEDYEIICVNDGSPDNCSEIVRNLQKEIPNIILIEQENQGVSMARNNAIAIAKGKYIMAIDPDDYVVMNTFKRILTLVEKDDLDGLYLGIEIFDITEKSIWNANYDHLKNQILKGVDGYFSSRGHDVRDPDRSVAILYKKALLEQYDIHYPKNVPLLEDGLFLAKFFTVAEKVSFDSKKFYQRTTREDSAMNSLSFFSEKAIQGFILAVHDIKAFGSKNNLNTEQIKLVNHCVAKFVILALSPSIAMFNFKTYYKTIGILKKAGLNKLKTHGLRFLYKKHIKMYNRSKLFFPIYFRLINR